MTVLDIQDLIREMQKNKSKEQNTTDSSQVFQSGYLKALSDVAFGIKHIQLLEQGKGLVK